MHVISKFHHPMFNCSEVIVLTNTPTNKQTFLETFTLLHCAMPVDKYFVLNCPKSLMQTGLTTLYNVVLLLLI